MRLSTMSERQTTSWLFSWQCRNLIHWPDLFWPWPSSQSHHWQTRTCRRPNGRTLEPIRQYWFLLCQPIEFQPIHLSSWTTWRNQLEDAWPRAKYAIGSKPCSGIGSLSWTCKWHLLQQVCKKPHLRRLYFELPSGYRSSWWMFLGLGIPMICNWLQCCHKPGYQHSRRHRFLHLLIFLRFLKNQLSLHFLGTFFHQYRSQPLRLKKLDVQLYLNYWKSRD